MTVSELKAIREGVIYSTNGTYFCLNSMRMKKVYTQDNEICTEKNGLIRSKLSSRVIKYLYIITQSAFRN